MSNLSICTIYNMQFGFWIVLNCVMNEFLFLFRITLYIVERWQKYDIKSDTL